MNNNKFIELAKQAGAAADHGVTGVDDENFLIMSDDEIEKFAELIIKECISELRDTFDMTIEEGNHLKEHFGVEE